MDGISICLNSSIILGLKEIHYLKKYSSKNKLLKIISKSI
ncbi:hypothetical protein LLB_3588 [Legionella longbeachae D-4968]|nr:hypothetical protein LLB_3588 [Legionella longbeachae D-4968]